MKMKRKLSIILCFMFTFLLNFNYGKIAAKADVAAKPELTVSSTEGDNYVHLNWTSPNTEKYYSYRLFSKESSNPIFQSIPSKPVVSVLNVYPGVGNNLKEWMEKPNSECDKGYGKGLISVDEVDISLFNSNPEEYLKDDKGAWKYDVVYFGAWNSNNFKDISEKAAKVVRNFADDGRGVLFGHDTIREAFNNFWSLRDLVKIEHSDKIAGVCEEVIGRVTDIKIDKKGLLINYPYELNEVLTIPLSHSNGNQTKADIWMRFTDNSYSYSPKEYTDPCNFYLASWNNCAMIQTGNNSGQASSDEEKILANTLFYLAQVTEETSCDDHKGQDLKSPTKPNIISVTNKSAENKIKVSFEDSQDIGSCYDYYVEAREKSTGETVRSDTKSITVTSGLKGYSIVVDKNENTVPDNTIETTLTEYELDNELGNDFYIHVAAVDNAGNVSEVSTYKYSRPVLELTPSTTEEVKDKVTIKAETSSSKQIEKIITPDGKEVKAAYTEYDVDVNGTYTFTAVDIDGNEVTESITINNIKPDIIINVEPNMNRTHLKENFIVDLTINNIESIFATEIRIKYDSSRLQFLGLDTVEGIELVNDDVAEGEITLLLASLGFENVLKDTTLLKLNFTGIAAGDALIDVVKADVADGDFMEKTLRDAECGETTISIVDRELVSVDNKDKAFTLLDLSIIAKHYGDNPDALLLEGIDADLNLDGKIDKEDYKKCYQLMLKNPNRKF